MTADVAKQYLLMCALLQCYDVDKFGVDCIPAKHMRWMLKRLILRGQNVTCALCGKPISRERDLTLDHIVPHSCGGSDWLHNMQPAHRKCNELKGNTVSDADVAASGDTVFEITERKKQRKESRKKHRNIKRIKPWDVDRRNNGR